MQLFQTFDTRTDAMLAVKTMASSYGTKTVQRDVCFINREKRGMEAPRPERNSMYSE